MTTVGAPLPRTITNGPFSGLMGLNQRIDIGITATDGAGNRGQVVVTANAQSIPLFQFGVFYNEDLEIHNGQNMDFAGWVHTNANLYLTPGGSAVTSFHDLITTPDSIFWQRKAWNERNANVRIDNAAAVAQTLAFDSRSNPGQSFVTASNTTFNGRVMTGVSGVQPLKLPLPDGHAADRAGPAAERRRRRRHPGRQVLPGRPPPTSRWTWPSWPTSTPAPASPSSARRCPPARPAPCSPAGPQGFWDGRENIGVDVFEIDMNALQIWAAGNAARDYSIIYITFTNVERGHQHPRLPGRAHQERLHAPRGR